jgi:hypothetical protein
MTCSEFLDAVKQVTSVPERADGSPDIDSMTTSASFLGQPATGSLL